MFLFCACFFFFSETVIALISEEQWPFFVLLSAESLFYLKNTGVNFLLSYCIIFFVLFCCVCFVLLRLSGTGSRQSPRKKDRSVWFFQMYYSLYSLEYRRKLFIVLLHYVFVLLVFFVLLCFSETVYNHVDLQGKRTILCISFTWIICCSPKNTDVNLVCNRWTSVYLLLQFFFVLLRILHSLMSAVASETANTHALFVSTIQVMNRDHSEI